MPTRSKSDSKSQEPSAAANGHAEGDAEIEQVAAEGGEEEEEEDDAGTPDEEYEVDQVLDHRKDRPGRYKYLVSWKGYGSEHNTWEPQDNLDHASDLVSAYWAKQPKTELGVKKEKRGRASQAPAGRPPKAPRVSAARGRPSRNGRAKDDEEEEEEDDTVPAFERSHVDSSDKYQDVKEWEEIVQSVDTIEKGSDGRLMVYLTMAGGEKVAQPTDVVYRRCPMKVLKFYETHLKWRAGD